MHPHYEILFVTQRTMGGTVCCFLKGKLPELPMWIIIINILTHFKHTTGYSKQNLSCHVFFPICNSQVTFMKSRRKLISWWLPCYYSWHPIKIIIINIAYFVNIYNCTTLQNHTAWMVLNQYKSNIYIVTNSVLLMTNFNLTCYSEEKDKQRGTAMMSLFFFLEIRPKVLKYVYKLFCKDTLPTTNKGNTEIHNTHDFHQSRRKMVKKSITFY